MRQNDAVERVRESRATSDRRAAHLASSDAIAEVDAAAWDACANPAADPVCDGLPMQATLRSLDQETHITLFCHTIFLSALEDVAIGRRPFRLAASARAGRRPRTATLVAAAPCYLKSHSRGEYVFDHGWAEAYEHAGGSYYPKLQVAVPFTPATGRRLLVRPGPQRRRSPPGARRRADRAVPHRRRFRRSRHLRHRARIPLPRRTRLSAAHRPAIPLGECGLSAAFDDFLAALAARKRKTIRRERHDALANGISVHWLTGSDLTEDVWDALLRTSTWRPVRANGAGPI